MLKTEIGKLDESQLLSGQKDNLLILRRSKLPGFDCPCGWPLKIGLNCKASAMRGTVTCPRCGLEQLDTTQTEIERRMARDAIMGTGQRVPSPAPSKVGRATFPNHRLFNRCPCSWCGKHINNVSIIRGELKEIKCGCGATCANLAIIDLGLEVLDAQQLADFFGPSAIVYREV